MSRVKGAVHALKRRRKLLGMTKGFRFGPNNKERAAHEALVHAGNYAFNDRKKKKINFRRLWTIRLNAALRPLGISYSKFIGVLAGKKIELDRKVMSEIAKDKPEAFERLVKKALAN